MLSLNSLSAFTQEVTRNSGITPARGTDRTDAARSTAATTQRVLQSAPTGNPPPGGANLPRGSLLDLRV
ncbi:hypothetical protein KPL78_05955 [Roseomonas sp. HJA6]|uniref:Uncharacterized protein n=1 Tax=Roseomonas alba TaxID=2846776 RepID=A0ABS7A7T5_9PROT|nr:hypothetical protein [Neoroseomonas alba]MBW6397385.1 hypothetical protein [Neoroseomonas alba]